MEDVSGQFKRPFKEQTAFFRNKLGNLISTEKWTDVKNEGHDTGFMVAGAQKAELLADFAAAVEKAHSQGTGIEAFRKDFDNAVGVHKWNDYTGGRNWRTRVIYNTNLSTSYSAGRLAQLREGDFAYWVYKHSKAVSDPRPEHVAWDGVTLPPDDPWWQYHFTPNGFGCQCRITGAKRRKSVARFTDNPQYKAPKIEIDPRTGEPKGIGKGWGYMPGNTVSSTVSTLAKKLPRLPARIGAAMNDSMPEKFAEKLSEEFGEFVDTSLADQYARGENAVVGALSVNQLDKLKKQGIEPDGAELLMGDKDIQHAFRDNKAAPVDQEWFKKLPEHIKKPDAVILDMQYPDAPALLYIFKEPQLTKIVVKLNFKGKVNKLDTVATRAKRENIEHNLVRTGHYVGNETSLVQPDYTVIEGSL